MPRGDYEILSFSRGDSIQCGGDDLDRQIADGLLSVNDPKSAKTMGDRGREWFIWYTWPAIASRMVGVYESRSPEQEAGDERFVFRRSAGACIGASQIPLVGLVLVDPAGGDVVPRSPSHGVASLASTRLSDALVIDALTPCAVSDRVLFLSSNDSSIVLQLAPGINVHPVIFLGGVDQIHAVGPFEAAMSRRRCAFTISAKGSMR